MFLLPIPRSPGEHGTEDHPPGMIARARRSFQQNVHMGVDGFIVCALLIQTLSVAGVMPADVWVAQPGYASIVCVGLAVLSACILFSLKSLLTRPATEAAQAHDIGKEGLEASAPAQHSELEPPKASAHHALIIHASRTTQAIIEKSLAKAAITSFCLSAEGGARQALQGDMFNVVITDAALLAHDALPAQRDLLQLYRAQGIPVLAVAGETIADAQGLTADAMVTTPIVPDDLASAALRLIAQPASRPQPAPRQTSAMAQRELPKLESEPLDSRALGDLEKLGGRDFVRDIVAQFVADAAAVLASLSAAVDARDPKNFREQAHALRSCAANVGAQNVYRMCLAWRDLDAQEIAASGAQCMRMLEAEFERVRGALTPMLQQGDGGAGPDSEAA
jgi:HPt (histidine-containing phosphotransfer) domain-containing protein